MQPIILFVVFYTIIYYLTICTGLSRDVCYHHIYRRGRTNNLLGVKSRVRQHFFFSQIALDIPGKEHIS